MGVLWGPAFGGQLGNLVPVVSGPFLRKTKGRYTGPAVTSVVVLNWGPAIELTQRRATVPPQHLRTVLS